MRIENKYGYPIDWKVFRPDDTAFVFGVREGSIAAGGVTEVSSADLSGLKRIKIRIARGFDELHHPGGEIYEADARMQLTKDGVLEQEKYQETVVGTRTAHYNHVDVKSNRDSPNPLPWTLTTALTFASEQTQSNTHSTSNSTSWGVKASAAGGVKGPKTKAGVKLSGSFESKVETAVSEARSQEQSMVESHTETLTVEIPAHHVAVLYTSWTTTIEERKAQGANGQEATYEVMTKAARTSVGGVQMITDEQLRSGEVRPRAELLHALAEDGVRADSNESPISIFRYQGDGEWTEEPARPVEEGGAAGTYTFNETGRNDWSLVLDDAGRGVRIELDLRAQMIRFGGIGDEQLADLYTIGRLGA